MACILFRSLHGYHDQKIKYCEDKIASQGQQAEIESFCFDVR